MVAVSARALKTETMHHTSYQQRNLSNSLNLANACMRSRMASLLADEVLVSHCDIRLATCL